ncbi:hypothetical protein [Marinobacter sp. BSs20148]|jgi:hypothetical protein|uniref:hypothetical protein n=1 Tax=Marinobacter sp. BSs20148 TaxID=490759 RepID=UPI00027768A5|nr:hypothetical protein [Marinobacter sp. BSs20148]AFP30824.1 hypothetical protein MRBBS_1887 [Marinobacter sp. BSs20148]
MTAAKTAIATSVARIFSKGELKASARTLAVDCDYVAKEIDHIFVINSDHEAEDLKAQQFNFDRIGKILPKAKSLPAQYGVQLS